MYHEFIVSNNRLQPIPCGRHGACADSCKQTNLLTIHLETLSKHWPNCNYMYIKSHLIKCIICKLSPQQPLPSSKIYGDDTLYANLKLLRKSTNLKLQINGCKHGSISPALVFRPREGLHFTCLCFPPPHCMIGRYVEIFFLSFFFPLLFRGLLGSLCVCVCVSSGYNPAVWVYLDCKTQQ